MTDFNVTVDTTLIEEAFNEMMAVEFAAREKELYAAWRSEYDYLYVLSSHDIQDPSLEFIPSNDPDRRFRGTWLERYDVRDEQLPEHFREYIHEHHP